jgi:hypothetical protein
VEQREQVTRDEIEGSNWKQEELTGFGGRRQPLSGDTSRISREAYVRFCERLGVKFPGPTLRRETGGCRQAPHRNFTWRLLISKEIGPVRWVRTLVTPGPAAHVPHLALPAVGVGLEPRLRRIPQTLVETGNQRALRLSTFCAQLRPAAPPRPAAAADARDCLAARASPPDHRRSHSRARRPLPLAAGCRKTTHSPRSGHP